MVSRFAIPEQLQRHRRVLPPIQRGKGFRMQHVGAGCCVLENKCHCSHPWESVRARLCPTPVRSPLQSHVRSTTYLSGRQSDRLSACRLPGGRRRYLGSAAPSPCMYFSYQAPYFRSRTFCKTRGLKTVAVSRVLNPHPTPKIFLENPLVGSGFISQRL